MTVEEESPTLDGDSKSQVDALRRFVVECDQLREMENILGRFNIFDVLRSTHNEIRHSNILAWLLDPKGSHGLGDLFLRRWLMRVFHEAQINPPIDPVAINTDLFRSVTVHREWLHIDLLLEIVRRDGQKWIICIENKVRAGQGNEQLARYHEKVEGSYKPPAVKAYILLSARAEEPDDPAYLVATYEQVARELKSCLDEAGPALGDAPRLLLEHYLTILKERFMENSKVTELARKIYRAHKPAIDAIIENRPDEISELMAATERLIITDAPKQRLIPLFSNNNCVRFVPESWNTLENTEDEHWRLVFCEINLRAKRPLFKMLAGRGTPEYWRKQLLAVAIKNDFPRLQKKQSYAPVWFNFCSVKLPKPDLTSLVFEEVEQVAEDIWTAIKKRIQTKEFQSIIDIVAKVVAKKPKA